MGTGTIKKKGEFHKLGKGQPLLRRSLDAIANHRAEFRDAQGYRHHHSLKQHQNGLYVGMIKERFGVLDQFRSPKIVNQELDLSVATVSFQGGNAHV